MIQGLADLIPPEVRQRWREEEARERKLTEQMRKHLGESLHWIGEAISRPSISREYLENALTELSRALSIAAVLDPEE